MKKCIVLVLISLLLVLGSASCTRELSLSEDAIATAIAETQESDDIRSLIETATAAAVATNTSEPPTDTPIPSDTPEPSLTPTFPPPEGMAYVPDFIGMQWDDVEKIFKEMGFKKGYYVAVVKWDVDEWSVFEQEPEPGILVDLEDGRVKVLVAVKEFTPTPERSRSGSQSSDPCGGITYAGVCQSNVVYWCDNNTLWYYDCSSCGGVCAWDDGIGFYCTCW